MEHGYDCMLCSFDPYRKPPIGRDPDLDQSEAWDLGQAYRD